MNRSAGALLLPEYRPAGMLSEPLTWVRSGGVEYLLPAADQVVTPYMLSKRGWDTTLGKVLIDAVRHAGTCFLDVGAMVGYFSALVGKTLPRCQVLAVEPNPAMLELAAVNAARYPNVRILEGGVSSSASGRLRFAKDETNVGNSRLAAALPTDEAIPTATLLDLVEEYRVDVVKIDVQGMEEDVLASLEVANLLLPNLTIFCEITPERWRGAERIDAAVAPFLEAGFSAYFLHEDESLASYSLDRLERAVASTSTWWDHFELVLARGTYVDAVRSR